jgi:hypothetical protein
MSFLRTLSQAEKPQKKSFDAMKNNFYFRSYFLKNDFKKSL